MKTASREQMKQYAVNMLDHYYGNLQRHRRMVESDLHRLNSLMQQFPFLRKVYAAGGLWVAVDNTTRKPKHFRRYRPDANHEPPEAA